MRIAFIGNCQVQTLSILSKHMLDGADVLLLDYSGPAWRFAEMRRDFADRLEDCDLIFAQTAATDFTDERTLRARFGDKSVTMANFYFRGLFPDSCYVGNYKNRLSDPTPVHSIVILDAFLRGMTEEEACGAFTIDNYQRLGIASAWTGSMEEIRRREANGTVDVPAAALVEEACRTYPAFLTMNHPSALLLENYLAQLFDFVSVKYNRIGTTRLPDPLARFDTTPILHMVADYYNLAYRTPQTWKIGLSPPRIFCLEDFVHAVFEVYQRTPRESLVINSPTDMVVNLRDNPALAHLVAAE